jgi:hypothetical protein
MFRICSTHRKEALAIPDDISVGPITTYSYNTVASDFMFDDSRELVNNILAQVNLTPIRSQTRKRLDKYSNSGLRRITSKLTGTMKVIQSMF